MNNIFLTGMPGSGKSTLAQAAAAKLRRQCIDLDRSIEKKYGGSINKIFAAKGEAYFRSLEKETLREVAAGSGLIVATGGGVVLDPENVRLMKESGLVIFIDRPLALLLEDVDIKKRPLLKKGREDIIALYEKRRSIYQNTADMILINDGGTAAAVAKLLDLIR